MGFGQRGFALFSFARPYLRVFRRLRGQRGALIFRKGARARRERMAMLCTSLNVTDRRTLERDILDIAANEQRRIGQELHDGTQQQLTGLALLAQNIAETLERAAGSSEEAGLSDSMQHVLRRARQVQHGLEHVAREVNQLSHGLIPLEIDSDDLMSSLAELAHSINDAGRAACTFHCAGIPEVANNSTATHLYRIAQEAVNNAVRHSRADRIEISLSRSGQARHAINLTVRDNGAGIGDRHLGRAGMGLRIMAYRANLIGAALNVGQASGGGTEVACTVPQLERTRDWERQTDANARRCELDTEAVAWLLNSSNSQRGRSESSSSTITP